MAVTSICGTLRNGQDNSCLTTINRKAFQQLVLINRSDIDFSTVVYGNPTEEECAYNVQFSLKEGATGHRIAGPEQGSSFKGFFDKTLTDNGILQYTHHLQMLLMGITEQAKCILSSLDLGSYVGAVQVGDIVEIYGFNSGLITEDYTWDIAENGGGGVIVLGSSEDNPESRMPFVYKSETPGGEIADFDALFANAAPSV